MREWDYWEKEAHRRAHYEEGSGCATVLVVIVTLAFVGLPLSLIAIDFWRSQMDGKQTMIQWPHTRGEAQ
jgi:hypothetical protein